MCIRFAGSLLSLALLGAALPGGAVAAPSKAVAEAASDNWIPGIVFVAQPVTSQGFTVTPDLQVTKADGSPRTYLTQPGQKPTAWQIGLPIYQGDQVRLNVLVATGGASLQTLIVRLDNKDQPLPTAGPWVVPIDTAPLSQGVHFIEVWALTAGPSPYLANRSADSTLAFTVAPAPPAGEPTGPVVDPGPVSTTPPTDPITPPTPEQVLALSPQLKGQTPNPRAQVLLHLRPSVDSPGALGPVPATLRIAGPTFLSADRPAASMATQYWYAIVRDAVVEVVPQALLETQADRLQLFPYGTDPAAPNYHKGLHPGTVTLYIWGVDRDNHPGAPVVTTLNIAG